MALECRPQMRRAEPGYPTSRETAADPGLLLRNVPAAWRGRGELRGALALLLGAGALAGNSGCTFGAPMAVEPLSEREALRIVKAELRQCGIRRIDEHVALRGAFVRDSTDQLQPLVVDLADPEQKWAVEYLPWDFDLRLFHPIDGQATLDNVAHRLESEVAAQAPDTHLKVLFNQQAVHPRDKAKAAARAKRELRQQVRDFVDWLRAQGAM
jgi:hypothetical protein